MKSSLSRRIAVSLAAGAFAAFAGLSAGQTFSNNTAITSPAVGVGSSYPSNITVGGVAGTISTLAFSVTVNFSHPNPREVDMILVSPSGDRIALMSDAGGTLSLTGPIRFSAAGRFPAIGESFVPGAFYQPTDFDTGDVMPAPCPAGPYVASFSGLAGDSPNGLWSLYVVDDTAATAGTISSWSITFGGTTTGSTIPSAFTYQGVLRDASGNPVTSSADFEFRLYDSVSSSSENDLIAGPITLSNVDLDDATGVFTVAPDFGSAPFLSSTAKFIEVSVRSPAGSGTFNRLSPRQRLNPAPVAQSAFRLATNGGGQSPAAESVGTSVRIYGDLDVDGGQIDLRSGTTSYWRVNGDSVNDYSLQLVTQATSDAGAVITTVHNVDETSRRTQLNAGLDIARTAEVGSVLTEPTILVSAGNDANLGDSAGYLVLGALTTDNLVLDANEVQARLNGAASELLLNLEGGLVGVNRNPTANSFEIGGNASKAVAGAWLANSDSRIKREVLPLAGALETLARVKPVTFLYTEEYAQSHPGIESMRRYYNVLAQDFQQVFPDAVRGSGEYLPGRDGDPAGEILQVDTYPATITSIAAINELHELVKKQQEQIDQLRKQLEQMRKQ